MSNKQIAFTVFLIAASVFLFISSVVWCFGKIIKSKRTPEKCNNAGVNTALVFSGFLILSIWILRFAVGYYATVVPPAGSEPLSAWEEILNSFFGAIRTFSMEEEYAKYVIDIKDLISEILPLNHWSVSVCQTATVAYASLLNLIAPIIGGAIILEILASVFPRIELRLRYMNSKRKKYFFSELNPASLALAKSISIEKKSEKPILIFTDTYVDDENEKEYELLLEAKQYGAICIRDDLAHVAKPKCGKREYYLMDENEFGNLQTLMGLIEDHNIKFIKDSYIYLFVQSDAYVQIEKQVQLKLNDEKKTKLMKRGEKPVIVPVHGYRNLVHNLLVDVPLYEPLVHKADPTKLSVTILGNGVIGTEAFLSVYWFGQMMVSQKLNGAETMTGCELTINVVSKDTEDVFWSKIDYVNPEIKATVEVLSETEGQALQELLVCDSKGTKSAPYCRVKYTQADLKIGGFWNGSIENSKQLLDSDYFIVALGNDSDNISIAERLRCAIGKKHVENQTVENVSTTVIAYAVFNSNLSSTLNEQKHFQSNEAGVADIYMHAFGNLDQVYSCDNVYMSQSRVWAEETGNAYLNARYSEAHVKDNKKRSGDHNANYNYWANLARAMHVKYKVFSLGWIGTSVFDCPSDNDCKTHFQNVKKQCGLYRAIASFDRPSDLSGEEKKRYNDIEQKKHCLAWLEHRRWCAFTRTMGYQYIDIHRILEQSGSHKDMQLKLHACLVETRLPTLGSGDPFILAGFDQHGKVDNTSILQDTDPDHHDRLDLVSFAKKAFNPERAGDFKEYDYYRYEFDTYIFAEELLSVLKNAGVSDPEKYINSKKDDMILCNTVHGQAFLLSVETAKWILRKKYKIVTGDKKDRYALQLCKLQKVKGAFEFHGDYFATRLHIWKAMAMGVICRWN